MKQARSYYECSSCEYRSAKWMGRCPSCGEWNTMQEHIAQNDAPQSARRGSSIVVGENKWSRAAGVDISVKIG